MWTVAGLDRAISIYESVGFAQSEERLTEEWGQTSREVRFDLAL